MRRACQELGLDIVTLQPFRDFEGMPPGRRERAMERAERKFDVMQELGCDLLMICSNVAAESLGGIERVGERLAFRRHRHPDVPPVRVVRDPGDECNQHDGDQRRDRSRARHAAPSGRRESSGDAGSSADAKPSHRT